MHGMVAKQMGPPLTNPPEYGQPTVYIHEDYSSIEQIHAIALIIIGNYY